MSEEIPRHSLELIKSPDFDTAKSQADREHAFNLGMATNAANRLRDTLSQLSPDKITPEMLQTAINQGNDFFHELSLLIQSAETTLANRPLDLPPPQLRVVTEATLPQVNDMPTDRSRQNPEHR